MMSASVQDGQDLKKISPHLNENICLLPVETSNLKPVTDIGVVSLAQGILVSIIYPTVSPHRCGIYSFSLPGASSSSQKC